MITFPKSAIKDMCEKCIENILTYRKELQDKAFDRLKKDTEKYNSMPWYKKMWYVKPLSHPSEAHFLNDNELWSDWNRATAVADKYFTEAKIVLKAIDNGATEIKLTSDHFDGILGWSK